MSLTHKSARPLSASLLAAKGTARPAQRTGQAYGQPRALFDVQQAPAAPATQQKEPSTAKTASVAAAPSTAPSGKKAAFTFRMDEHRHFRLRLLSAHQNRSSQKIMEEALDAYLETHAPQTESLACPCFQKTGLQGGSN